MANFISLYPVIAIWFIGVLGSVIGGLATVTLFLLKLSVDRLNTTIKKLTIDQENTDGKLTDLDIRLVKQETKCKICQDNCFHLFLPRGDERRVHEERRAHHDQSSSDEEKP